MIKISVEIIIYKNSFTAWMLLRMPGALRFWKKKIIHFHGIFISVREFSLSDLQEYEREISGEAKLHMQNIYVCVCVCGYIFMSVNIANKCLQLNFQIFFF